MLWTSIALLVDVVWLTTLPWEGAGDGLVRLNEHLPLHLAFLTHLNHPLMREDNPFQSCVDAYDQSFLSKIGLFVPSLNSYKQKPSPNKEWV